MKKTLRILVFSVALICAMSAASTYAQIFDKGDKVISAGLGLGATYYSLGGTSMVMPVIFASGDYCLREDLGPGNLGIGAIIAYSSYKENVWGDYYYKVNSFMLGARGTYHFTDLVDKLDLYGGITLGGEIVNSKWHGEGYTGSYSDPASGLLSEVFAGARYYFTDNIAANGELGYGIAWLKLAISFKF